ncbi:hypothetical protein TanjilG_16810 [Lupinus angustifolius]|uniref:Uncharacterized protein n=1 Tax=Lupinus angustifolius TaxID=3871 RepID=A0A394DFF7_LUPAN|nr:hypothetical protein TanjilG_16810 [Lupinus angustifolius]
MMMTAKSPAISHQPNSSWHFPVPYLFNGFATMLSLIAFAILIRLAYNFWKLSEQNEENEEAKQELEAQKATPQTHEKIFVVMAGQEKPTFLATPMCSNKSSSL